MLERTVATRLEEHLQSKDHFQSGFRSKRSTETALVKVTNDLLLAADSGFLSVFILLTPSTALVIQSDWSDWLELESLIMRFGFHLI